MSKILVVDDDSSTTALVKMLLELEGYDVVTATRVAAAMANTGAEAAVLIIDCHLSNEESGIEFMQAIRRGQTDFPSDVPAILVSGDQRLREAAEAVGASLFLLKPYPPDELTRQIKKLLAARA